MSKPTRNTRFLTKKQKQFLVIYDSNLGAITAACRGMKMARKTYYNWMEKSPAFRAAIADSDQEVKDFGENCLKKLMRADNPAAIIFFNKTKNRDRGYAEKQEIEHTSGDSGFQLIIEAPVDGNDKRSN